MRQNGPKRQENGPTTAAEAQDGPPHCLSLSRRAAVPGAATGLAAKLVFGPFWGQFLSIFFGRISGAIPQSPRNGRVTAT